MSLLDDYADDCVLYTKTVEPDGYGGYKPTYTPGVTFKASIGFDSSMQARIADKQGVTSLYTVLFPKSLSLEYHDVFKRTRDGKVFRVTSDGDDLFTPSGSALEKRKVTAEEWQFPS